MELRRLLEATTSGADRRATEAAMTTPKTAGEALFNSTLVEEPGSMLWAAAPSGVRAIWEEDAQAVIAWHEAHAYHAKQGTGLVMFNLGLIVAGVVLLCIIVALVTWGLSP
jgi:hypothetical protein